MTSAAIVGRDAELAAVERFLGRDEPGLSALVLEGGAGMGKTTLWREGVRRAGEGLGVLSARPAEAEARLSYASLGDLLAPVSEESLAALPEPQRHALEVALLRSAPRRARVDQRAVGMALGSLLIALAAERPLLLAIDDLQWLDRATALVLGFALRRLDAARVRLLGVRRADSPPGVVEEAVGEERLERLPLRPLTLAALHVLTKERLGKPLPRLLLLRVEDASGGNPMHALELARALAEAPPPAPGEPLSVPSDLLGLMRARLDRLAPSARGALLAAAALSRPTAALLGRAVPRARPALAEAVRSGVLEEREDGRLRFAHPLLAAAVLSSVTAAERRRLHARLAEVVSEVEERARHLALASEGPDASVAAALSEAASSARARAATDAGAELAELAWRLTPEDDPERPVRRLDLAEYLFHAGESDRAERLLEELRASLPPSPLRARALVLLASFFHESRGGAAADALCELALADAGDDEALRARIFATWALAGADDIVAAGRRARAALELLGKLEEPDPRLEGLALLAHLESEFYLGHGLDEAAARRALELERDAPALRVADRVAPALGAWLKYADRLDEARELLVATLRAAREEHDEGSLPFALSHLPQLELWAGDWPLARSYAYEHLELAGQMGLDQQRTQALLNVALVEAHLGAVEAARAAIAEGLALAAALGSPWAEASFRDAAGFLEWSLGDAAATVASLERAGELRGTMQLLDPGYGRSRVELVEALAALGELERALPVVDELETRARALDRPARLAVALRCRVVLAAAAGDAAAALALSDEALAQHARLTNPFDLARTLLVKGRVERRAKRKRAAGESLARALEIFESLGAALWAAAARDELARVGLRRSAGDGLTPTERQVAALAARGLTNREVAAQLFMSPKTVEANLARAYRKLGIRSRAELGARLAGSGAAQT